MRVLLKFTIDVDADAAWHALHARSTLAELYAPLLRVAPLAATAEDDAPGPGGAVQLSLLGAVPLGRQLIDPHDRSRTDASGTVRIFRDTGIPLTGPLSTLDVWDHQMAVSPAPGDSSRTLWRDRLVFDGPGAALLWPALWGAWQWRQQRIRALAPTWAFEPAPADDDV